MLPKLKPLYRTHSRLSLDAIPSPWDAPDGDNVLLSGETLYVVNLPPVLYPKRGDPPAYSAVIIHVPPDKLAFFQANAGQLLRITGRYEDDYAGHLYLYAEHAHLMGTYKADPRFFPLRDKSYFTVPPPPVELAGRYRAPRWRKLSTVIYLMTSRGLSTSWDLMWLMDLPLNEITHMTVWKPLVAGGFAERIATVPLSSASGPFSTITIFQPTQLAYDIANAYGWEIAPKTDWQRLAEVRKGARKLKHSAAVLAAAHHLRRRQLNPRVVFRPPDEPAPTDVSFADPITGEVIYLEVEINPRTHPVISPFDDEQAKPGQSTGFHPPRWRRRVAHQGYVTVCTISVGQRRRLVRDLREHGFTVSATDLATLAARTSFTDGFTDSPFFVQNQLPPVDHKLWRGQFLPGNLYRYQWDEPDRPDDSY